MINLIIGALVGLLALLIRPGVNVLGRESSTPSTDPTDTGVALAAILSERGRTDKPFKVTSWSDAQRKIGARTNWNAIYWDAIESFFKTGGAVLWLSRIVGPASVLATANLDGPAAGAPFSLTINAVGEGDWYNGIRVSVEVDPADANGRRVVVTHNADSTVREESPYYTTQQELVDWSQASQYIRLVLGGEATMPAVVANVALVGGADDRASIVTAQRQEALDRFTAEYGKGNQVSIPGATAAAEWTIILEHARDFDRNAVLDYPDSPTEATLTTLADTARAVGRYGAAFWPWIRLPLAGSTSKLVPPSLAVAGKIAKQTAETGGWGQNKPVAGIRRGRGVIRAALDVSQVPADEDAVTRLNAAGVNVIRNFNGAVTIYGWRSLASESGDPNWTNFGHRRLYTAIATKADNVMEDFVFDEIDGDGRLFGQINGALVGSVMAPYYREGSLYGKTPEEAFRVDTGSEVNTEETIEAKTVGAVITFVPSEFAEEISIELVKNLISEGVS